METSYQYPNPAESKAQALLKYAPIGLTEIDKDGYIVNNNIRGTHLLEELWEAYSFREFTNVYPLLEVATPELVNEIRNFQEPAGIASRRIHKLSYSFRGEATVRVIEFVANKLFDTNIMLSLDDITEKYKREEDIRKAILDKAVEQSKYELASGILHDIGNAIVGFGSYLTRIRRVEEQNSTETLHMLSTFVSTREKEFGVMLGEDKAKAITDMMRGLAADQSTRKEEINKAISEQLNIITHIQEILNIQRQYVSGYGTQERKPVQIRSVINDCMAMLFASYDKKEVAVELDLTTDAPPIKGDRTQLMQVIINILKNSLDAMDIYAREKRVQVKLTYIKDNLLLTVRDTGCGFENETGTRLFERGFTTKSSGSGLGLYNCRAILESHDGSIEITSEGKDKGALTTISFKA
jgi:signal transduction histidine kinase